MADRIESKVRATASRKSENLTKLMSDLPKCEGLRDERAVTDRADGFEEPHGAIFVNSYYISCDFPLPIRRCK